MNVVQLRKLSYEEVARCNKCGFCLPSCPIYGLLKTESSSPRGRNAITRAVIEGRLQWSPEIEKTIFRCLGCGACTVACFPSVKTRDLVFRDRQCLVDEGLCPEIGHHPARHSQENHHLPDEDNAERGDWRSSLMMWPRRPLPRTGQI